MWRAFRAAEPINYGYILYRKGLITPFRYWWQFRQGLAYVITYGLAIFVTVMVFSAYFTTSFPSYVIARILYGDGAAPDWTLASGESVIRYYQ